MKVTDRLEGDQHSSFILLHASLLTAALICQEADHVSDSRPCCFQGDEGLLYLGDVLHLGDIL